MLKTLTIAAVLGGSLMLAQPSWAQRYVFRRPGPVVVVRPYPYYGFGPWYGGYGWYNPWSGRAYAVAPATGEVKIVTHMKDALVYVDGGYAGLAGKLKHFDLSPGSHNVELRDSAGTTIFKEHIQVIRDKTTEIHVD
jgi:hypothetical protein